LAFLKPCIFENFERGEQHGNTADAICFRRAMPVFDDRDEGTHLIEIGRLRREEIEKRAGERVNYY